MKRYFEYFGPPEKYYARNHRFVVEVENYDYDSPHMTGVVVAANKGGTWEVGHESRNWVNPVEDIRNGFPAEFNSIGKERLSNYWGINHD